MDAERIRSLAAAAPVGRLATVGAGCEPHLVPFCFALEWEADVIYSAVDWKPKATADLRRLRDVELRPRVAVLVDHYEEDWNRLWWVRADGRARKLEGGPDAETAVELLTAKYRQYRVRPPAGPVLRIEVDRWRGWEAV